MRLLFLAGILGVLGSALTILADEPEAGKKAEQRSCSSCHSMRLIDSQRLSAGAWNKEVDKMVGWGAIVPDRRLLIEYLVQHYSNVQPAPSPALSADSK